jgi:hypothetical protein
MSMPKMQKNAFLHGDPKTKLLAVDEPSNQVTAVDKPCSVRGIVDWVHASSDLFSGAQSSTSI